MHIPRRDRLVEVNVAVTDFDIESTIRIYANPCFVMDSGSLATIVRERDETPYFAVQTFGHSRFRH